jgi:Domain of unknown function (DUF4157)
MQFANKLMAAQAQHVAPGIQRFSGQFSGQTGSVPTSVDHALACPGRPLEPALRQDMEQRFGHDFSTVRVHIGAAAAQSASDVNARAYTVGPNVVFGAGQFAPETNEGRRLLAHELTHVVQQSVSSLKLARAPKDPLTDEIKAAEEELEAEKVVAEDFLEELGRAWPKGLGKGRIGGRRTVGQLIAELRRVARRGGAEAQRALGLEATLEASRRRIGDLHRRRGTTGVPPRRPEYSGAKVDETAAKAEHAAEKRAEAATKAETSAVKTSVRADGQAAKTLVKVEEKVGETAIKAEAKLGPRFASGAGRLGLSMLLPGPEDAIMLMVQFAGSYEEAWDIIEQRNTRSGIAMGIAAGMMGLEWDWVKQNLWRRFATRDVATEVVAAVGKAELSYNDGLGRGHKYGAGFPRGTKNRILKEVFTILGQQDFKTDEAGLFTIETVARVAGVLMPIADGFLRQAAERKQAREKREEEQRRREVGRRSPTWR